MRLKEKLIKSAMTKEGITILFLMLLTFILPFNQGAMTNSGIVIAQSLILLVFIFSLIQRWHKSNFKIDINWLEILFLLAILWGIIGISYSVYRYSSVIMVIDLVFLALLYFSLKIIELDHNIFKIIIYAILATAFLSALWAFAQYFILHVPRPSAWFLNPNYLAVLMNIALSFLIALILFEKFSLQNRLIVIGFSIILFAALLFTKSRGGFLSLLVMLFLALFIRNKKWLLIPAILLILIVVIPNPLRNHVVDQWKGDIYAYKRIEIWGMSFRMIADKPLQGFTPGNYNLYAPAYNFPVKEAIAHYGKVPRQAHNSLLQWSVEMGVPGIILLLAGLVIISIYAQKIIKNRKEFHPLILGVVFAITTVFVQSLFSNNLYNRAIMLYCGILIFFLQKHTFSLSQLSTNSIFYKQYVLKYQVKSGNVFKLSIAFLAIAFFILVIFIPFFGQLQFEQSKNYLMKSHISKEDATKGSKKLQLAIKLVPIQAYYHKYMADVYRDFFSFSSNLDAFFYAYNSYTRAIKINPVEGEFYIGRINLYSHLLEKGYQSQDVFKMIEDDFETFIRLRPKNAFAYYDFGKFYLRTNRIELAKDMLIRAIELEPNFIAAHYYLMKTYNRIGNTVQGKKQLSFFNELCIKFQDYSAGDNQYLKKLLHIPNKIN
jgi:O-antigen ligase